LTARDILAGEYDLIKDILTEFQRSGKDWDDYIHKTGPKTRGVLKEKFVECRQHGFFSLRVDGDEIAADVLVYPRLHGSRRADYSKIDGKWTPE
jgi:hypothetical protein